MEKQKERVATEFDKLKNTVKESQTKVRMHVNIKHQKYDQKFTIKSISQKEKKKCGYRVAKTHRIPYLYSSFLAKVTYI